MKIDLKIKIHNLAKEYRSSSKTQSHVDKVEVET